MTAPSAWTWAMNELRDSSFARATCRRTDDYMVRGSRGLGSAYLHSVDESRQRLGYETQARHWGEIERGLENIKDRAGSVERDVDGFSARAVGGHGWGTETSGGGGGRRCRTRGQGTPQPRVRACVNSVREMLSSRLRGYAPLGDAVPTRATVLQSIAFGQRTNELMRSSPYLDRRPRIKTVRNISSQAAAYFAPIRRTQIRQSVRLDGAEERRFQRSAPIPTSEDAQPFRQTSDSRRNALYWYIGASGSG